MLCPKCGNDNQTYAEYCNTCGTLLRTPETFIANPARLNVSWFIRLLAVFCLAIFFLPMFTTVDSAANVEISGYSSALELRLNDKMLAPDLFCFGIILFPAITLLTSVFAGSIGIMGIIGSALQIIVAFLFKTDIDKRFPQYTFAPEIWFTLYIVASALILIFSIVFLCLPVTKHIEKNKQEED